MGEMENSLRDKNRIGHYQKVILQSIAAIGLLGVGLLMPNALGAMAKLGLLPKGRKKEAVARSRDRLIKAGLVEYQGKFLRLTEEGVKKLRLLELQNFKLSKPRRWDGKWRVLIFDIPERRRGTREKVRRTLISAGFMRLQDSVWVYPYDCEDFIVLLKADFRIGKDLLYLIVELMENDSSVRRYFGLF